MRCNSPTAWRLLAPLWQYTKSGVSFSATASRIRFSSWSGTFLLPGIWPSWYSWRVRTSSRTAPQVSRHSFMPSSMPGPRKKSKNPIAASPYSMARIRSFGFAPTIWWMILPSFTTTSVGMLITPNCPASSGCSSTLIFPTLMSGRSPAISSMTGDTMRHGPHQGAQKSSRTGLSEWTTSSWKFSLWIVIADMAFASCFFCFA